MPLSAVTAVIYPKQLSTDMRDLYKIALLKKTLEISKKKYGPYTLKPSTSAMSEARMDALMTKGDGSYLNIIFKATTQDREKNMTAVKIPILKGLLGYRVFLINKNRQDEFSKIKTLTSLKTLTVGQGLGWRDVEVFKSHGVKVITSPDYEGLFDMVVNNRFDYFSRGITEAPQEYGDRRSRLPELAIEDTILLYYPWPVYYFTMKNQEGEKLAERIEYGLNELIKSGEFDRLFNRYYKGTFKDLHLKNRKFFTLKNPILPDDTPLEVKQYWISIDDIQ